MAKKQSQNGGDLSPRGDRVLIRPVGADDTKSPGGIIIPDSAKKKESKRGVVVALGPGKTSEEGTVVPINGISVGDTVLFRQGWDNEIDIDNETHYIVAESDILAVIK